MKRSNIAPYLNTSLSNLKNEEWRDVFGFDGIYNVSNYGRVKSVDRWVTSGIRERHVKERILKQDLRDVASVKLSINGIAKTYDVSNLVSNAFLRFKNENEVVCHKNKVQYDNRVSNLVITTYSKSMEVSYKLGVMNNWGIDQLAILSQKDYLQKFGIYENGILIGKICSRCSSERKLEDFYKGNICKTCTLKRAGVRNLGVQTHRKELAKSGLRNCTICNEIKSLDSEFAKYKSGFMGRKSHCKSCDKVLNAKNRAIKKNQPL